jgi:hypothetical protein
MRKRASRLTLNRETLLRLDETKLRYLNGGVTLAAESENACTSPRCALTEWDSCTCM